MINQYNHHKTATGSFVRCLQGTIADRVLLLSLLLGIIFLWLQINQHLSSGPITAYVYHQQQLLAQYPLPTDDSVIHVPANGEIGTSEIEISRQGIRFLSSPCTTHHCTLAGQKSYTGSVLACVPNHIMVVIRGTAQGQPAQMTFDAISE